MFQAIIGAIQKKNDGIKNSFANLAQTQSAFSGQPINFNPQSSALPTAQTNNNNSQSGGLANLFKPKEQTQPQFGAIGQEIQNQTEDKDLYNYLRI